jgi:hypothetical protein
LACALSSLKWLLRSRSMCIASGGAGGGGGGGSADDVHLR